MGVVFRRNCHHTRGAGTLPKISIDHALSKANSHAKKGEIEEAKILYQSVLQVSRRTFVRSKV